MAEKDREILRVFFNTAYCLVKQEQPFSDYPALLKLQFKNGVKEFKSYTNDRAAAGFTDAVGDVMKDSLVRDLMNAVTTVLVGKTERGPGTAQVLRCVTLY